MAELAKAKGISKSENKNIFKKFAEMFGLEVVEKGAFSEKHAQRKKVTAFWDAFYYLQDVLYRHNPETGAMEFEMDSEKIKECLSEFSEVIQEVLTGGTETIAKASKIYNNNSTFIKLEYIDKICRELGCSVGDIMQFD